jgi:hypothetical protein
MLALHVAPRHMTFTGILKTHAWAYPALEVVHMLGIALLLGNLVLLELRVFGRGASAAGA